MATLAERLAYRPPVKPAWTGESRGRPPKMPLVGFNVRTGEGRAFWVTPDQKDDPYHLDNRGKHYGAVIARHFADYQPGGLYQCAAFVRIIQRSDFKAYARHLRHIQRKRQGGLGWGVVHLHGGTTALTLPEWLDDPNPNVPHIDTEVVHGQTAVAKLVEDLVVNSDIKQRVTGGGALSALGRPTKKDSDEITFPVDRAADILAQLIQRFQIVAAAHRTKVRIRKLADAAYVKFMTWWEMSAGTREQITLALVEAYTAPPPATAP